MLSLADLQHGFAQVVRGRPAGALGVVAGALAPERRLLVYRNHHRLSLAAALAANLPTVLRVVGDQAFQVLAMDFMAQTPPAMPCLAGYGDGFPDFLAADPRVRPTPYLADIARLDLAFNLAERADESPAFGSEDLALSLAADLDALRLRPHPAMSLIASPYPLLRIRALAHEGGGGVSLAEGGVDLMVWRRGNGIACSALDVDAAHLVRALAEGKPLAAASQAIQQAKLSEILATFVVSGAFSPV